MRGAYYNENDPFAAAWLRNLIAEGLIAPGDVDERSIVDVRGDDLKGYGQCHFFAGIGGWSLALRLAGIQDDEPIWTGSCPCQPVSVAGQRQGHADERHLWPAFYRLIAERRPAIVFGEQVASKDGREWLAAVRADLETLGYACGAADLCAAGVGAPHIRQRIYWLADANGGDASSQRVQRSGQHGFQPEDSRARELGDAMFTGRPQGRPFAGTGQAASGGGVSELGDADDSRSQRRALDFGEHADKQPAWAPSEPSALADAEHAERRPECKIDSNPYGRHGFGGGSNAPWSDLVWLQCTDGKARPTKPGIFPLAHGFPNRMGILRGAGNAIIPQVAAQFVIAALECLP